MGAYLERGRNKRAGFPEASLVAPSLKDIEDPKLR